MCATSCCFRSVTHVPCDLTPIRTVGVGVGSMELFARGEKVLGFTPFPHFVRQEPRHPAIMEACRSIGGNDGEW